MNSTCKKDEYLEIEGEVLKLAKEILSDLQIKEADQISEELAESKSKKNKARKELKQVMHFGPKRPMYYLQRELSDLPRWTRDAMRYLGDYVDHLVKFYSAELCNNDAYKKRSLGINLNAIGHKIPDNLYSILHKYNKLLYVPAKHDMVVINRRHRFTCKEVVYACFMTKRISEIIVKLSKAAKLYSEDKLHN